MSLYDIAILTRANTARTVGISHRKGSLGVGADGDVTIYNIDPKSLNVRDHENLAKNFAQAEYTIKDGEIVSRRGEIRDLIVWQGPNKRPLSNFFDVKGDGGKTPGDTSIVSNGDVSRVKRIGNGMTAGKITINGSAGMHVGSEMSGVAIVVGGAITNFLPGFEQVGSESDLALDGVTCPGEYTMVDVLRDRDVDAAFVTCADLVCHIPADPASVSLGDTARLPRYCAVPDNDCVRCGAAWRHRCDGVFGNVLPAG